MASTGEVTKVTSRGHGLPHDLWLLMLELKSEGERREGIK
jgi:hypothetical protein